MMRKWLHLQQHARSVPAVRRMRLQLEPLEQRYVPSVNALSSPADLGKTAQVRIETVYTESNDPEPGENAVLAFSPSSDGTLQQIGTFSTHGTGQLNLPKVVGPDDSSQEVVATSDGRLLFAVNQGSNTVAAFGIRRDGSLEFRGTFNSGGVQPDSIGIVGNLLYVSNRGDATVAGPGGVPAANPGTVAPNITGFTIDPDGSLAPISGATVTFPVGTVPSQNLIAGSGKLLISDIFGVNTAPQSNTLAPFQIESDGTLKLAPGGNVAAQAPGSTTAAPALLGADTNPNLPIVYAGLTGLNEVAVFTYDASGQLTFIGVSDPNNQGGKGPCWVAVSPDGKFLYTGDTGSDSVGVYSLANPTHPVQIQELFLGGPHTPPGSPPGAPGEVGAFQVVVDPSGQFVYAISQNTDPHGLFQEGNQLHILAVSRDGTLSETNGPVILPAGSVPGTAHPQGIAVVPGVGRRESRDPEDHGPHGNAAKRDTARIDAVFAAAGSGGLDLSEIAELLTHHHS